MHKFAEFAQEDEKPIDGEKVPIASILNQEIIITKFKVRPSKYKDKSDECATVQFYIEGENRNKIFFTGSSVIISMLKKYEKELPFLTVVKKIDKYYTLS